MADQGTGEGGRYRIVQWATGRLGSSSLRKVIEHPGMELVGVLVHTQGKEGKDAGDLCGLPATSIRTTRSLDEIIALKPDCVLHMQEGVNFDEICKLLESGANIVSTRSEFLYPKALPAPVREQIEAACRKGNSTIHSTGSSPGFVTEALPIALSSIQQQIDSIVIDEFADMVLGCSPFMLFETMGYGKPLSSFNEQRLAMIRDIFVPTLMLLADTLGKPAESFEASAEVAAAKRPIEVPGEGGGIIEPGTLAAERVTVSAMRDGKPFVTFRTNWYCSRDIDADWQLRDVGWRVRVASNAPINVEITFPIPEYRLVETLCDYSVNLPVNAVRAVCAAPAGMVTSIDLPWIHC